MAFEKFTKAASSFKAKASISPRGFMGFSQGACKAYDMKKYEYAVMFYDREALLLAVKLTNNVESGAIKIRHRTYGSDLSIKSFLDFYQIRLDGTYMYDVAEVIDPELKPGVMINLKEGRKRKSSKSKE